MTVRSINDARAILLPSNSFGASCSPPSCVGVEVAVFGGVARASTKAWWTVLVELSAMFDVGGVVCEWSTSGKSGKSMPTMPVHGMSACNAERWGKSCVPQLLNEPHQPLLLGGHLHLEHFHLLLVLLLGKTVLEEEGDGGVVMCSLLHHDDRSEVRNPGTRASRPLQSPPAAPEFQTTPPQHDQHCGDGLRRGLQRRSAARVASTTAGVAPCGVKPLQHVRARAVTLECRQPVWWLWWLWF